MDEQEQHQKHQIAREGQRRARDEQQLQLKARREAQQEKLRLQREQLRERNDLARERRREALQLQREKREQARQIRHNARAKKAAATATFAEALKAAKNPRMIPMSIAAQKYNVNLEQLQSWHADGLLEHVAAPGPRRYSQAQGGDNWQVASADPLLEEGSLELVIKRLGRLERREGIAERLREALHIHRYHEIRVETVWSTQLRQEIMISQQTCSCGQQRKAIREHMRLGWRTIAIEAVPRGTWDTPPSASEELSE